jgi:hypothetical protein
MRSLVKSYQRRWCIPFASLLVAMVLAAPNAEAKGPPASEPEPDFVIETVEYIDYNTRLWDSSGTIVDIGSFDAVEVWTDGDGIQWARYRFDPNGPAELGYFEIVLPTWPDHRVEYPIVFTAGPDGYLNGKVLDEGEWAVGTATGRIRQRKELVWYLYDQKWGWAHFQTIEWTLNGYFLP